ncbi:hypothetical protein PHMEG_00040414 [Phytophthora megakarya]|uniref:Uncharacterized protein n=1 Tax=Phytophthora megakarya TaxID=4795 RepID=A0A225UEV6_9STRA|nr:hypothetical protein PHMEG_00040414 [Phytophthora megakarya]
MGNGTIPKEVGKLLVDEIDPAAEMGALFNLNVTGEESVLLKRGKFVQQDVVYEGPVSVESYSVPVESIEMFQKLHQALRPGQFRPLCFLCGPRQFGKTTIAYGLWDFPSVLVIFRSLAQTVVETEEDFWLSLSNFVHEEPKSFRDFESMLMRRKQRLNFVHYLRGLQNTPYFLGFLGTGSYELVELPTKLKQDDYSISPFNLGTLFQVKRFSTQQMRDFFKLIERTCQFRSSTQVAIMEYSAGATGVFGSLIRHSSDYVKYNQERHEWERWFKIQNFSRYLDFYNSTYKKIREDLKKN